MAVEERHRAGNDQHCSGQSGETGAAQGEQQGRAGDGEEQERPVSVHPRRLTGLREPGGNDQSGM